jgi:hypothetical protein
LVPSKSRTDDQILSFSLPVFALCPAHPSSFLPLISPSHVLHLSSDHLIVMLLDSLLRPPCSIEWSRPHLARFSKSCRLDVAPFDSAPLCSAIFLDIQLQSFTLNPTQHPSIQFNSTPFQSAPFHSIPVFSIPLHSTQIHSNSFKFT